MAGVHEDFGEKIGGAKKDLWKDRGLYVDDLDAMNDREMLGSVGRGLIMGNAMAQLKAELPHLPVIGHCRNEAVSHFLTHWLDNNNLPYSPE